MEPHDAQFKVVEIVRAPVAVAVAVVVVVCGVVISTGASVVNTNGLTSFFIPSVRLPGKHSI